MSEVVEQYLKSCRELAELTHYNGWIDNDTLKYQLVSEERGRVVADVQFEEVFISACCEERAERWGRVQLELDSAGTVKALLVL
ncbi:MAG: hypothetical protein HOL04_11970 [Gammaproteobacteria bacterium]|jgi:hypothetical protein|nr:hypothetical protein [Gammaproteobacteria bacterium]MBT4607718.1 hypothetical protein [Thiotrichales bacterium]MBT4079798.1 hypothetical protein [Gammaproteobacteria bacterium]MBT4811049.1 hypothetical protein [Thiotrichales bacterium]MBT5362450.1 hypothetical protein [Gammaproteobacteria bacterium]